MLDILQFQVDEIKKVSLKVGEDESLEEEKRRLNNVEKLSTLSDEAYLFLYENEEAAIATFGKAAQRITELAEYESSFREYTEGLQTAQAVLEDLAFAVRDFRGSLEFSPERLEEIETRLAEIARLKRKYGGSDRKRSGTFRRKRRASEKYRNRRTARKGIAQETAKSA